MFAPDWELRGRMRLMRAVMTDLHFLVALGVLCAGVAVLAVVH